jgi:LmbE family N-acetylglucosaminyl deacetylase
MNTVLVIAPHPDDETLGCGGTLLRHIREGESVHWLIVTAITEEAGFTVERIASREAEIEEVARRYGFDGVHRLGLDTTQLDAIPMALLVGGMSDVFRSVNPNVVYLPYRHDVHTDHAAVFDAAVACTKWFRYPSVQRVLVYETLSETDFNLNPDVVGFRPNVFVDVTDYVDEKIAIMNVFESEMGDYPFPRSDVALRALGEVRGAASGFRSAEAFMLLRERI